MKGFSTSRELCSIEVSDDDEKFDSIAGDYKLVVDWRIEEGQLFKKYKDRKDTKRKERNARIWTAGTNADFSFLQNPLQTLIALSSFFIRGNSVSVGIRVMHFKKKRKKKTVSRRVGGIRFWNVEVVLIDEELIWRTGEILSSKTNETGSASVIWWNS